MPANATTYLRSIDSEDGSIFLNAAYEINLIAGGQIILDAKDGVFYEGEVVEVTDDGTGAEAGQSSGGGTDSKTGATAVKTNDTGDRKGSVENTGCIGDTTMTGMQQIMNDYENFASQKTGSEMAETEKAREVLNDSQITEIYWSYGDDYTALEDKSEDGDWISQYYYDLNFHVKTKEDNDGKTVKVTIENRDGLQIDLSGIISDNNVAFKEVFKKYIS